MAPHIPHCCVCAPMNGWRKALQALRLVRWSGGFCRPCARREVQVRSLQRKVNKLQGTAHRHVRRETE